ncbi:MAG: FAD-dependent oxidoreductase [Leucobacter sp.]|nr:FAD-dependent oxidoreductase [Leucobacter sp.]
MSGQVSHWSGDAGRPVPRLELPGSIFADVAIVGAGYTGLWTAYYLKQARPSLRVVVIEERHVGSGASGRDSGAVTNAITGGRERYVAAHGRDAAQRFQAAMTGTVSEVVRVAEAERINADVVHGGEFAVATTPAQEARLRAYVASERQCEGTDLTLLEPAAASRIDVAGARAASWHPHAARIQPVKLARGLANAVERLGVAIYERTRVVEIDPYELQTTHGTVTADHIVATGAGGRALLAGARRRWLPVRASLIATTPLPAEIWEQIGWAGGDILRDSARGAMFAQRTADDRIVLGERAAAHRFASRAGGDAMAPERTVRALRESLQRLFPVTREVELARAWSGALAASRGGSASVGFDLATGIAWGGGYAGSGIAASNLAGRTITDLVLERETDLVTLPWVQRRMPGSRRSPFDWVRSARRSR